LFQRNSFCPGFGNGKRDKLRAVKQFDVDTARESPAEEVALLRRCLNDLVSVMALPALWACGESPQIARTLMDALLGMLRPAFVFVRMNDAGGGPSTTEIVRAPELMDGLTRVEGIGDVLAGALGHEPRKWPARAQVSIEGAEFFVASARLGIDGEIGIVAVGCQRIDFPEQTERLLLDVATNQAAIGLQQERNLAEQRLVARELDERVAQRTTELAAANELLKRSENESRLIVDSIPGLIALLSPTGDLEMVNRQLLEYFGQTLEQLRAWGTNDTVHPEDLPHVIDVFSRSVAAGSPYEIVQRFKRSDGVYRWFQNRGFPLRDLNGNVARWSVLLTDIDDQKRAEEALRESEYESRLIVDSIPGMVGVVNTNGHIERVSQPLLDYYGKLLEEVNLWMTGDEVHPEDLPGLTQAFTQSLASGDPTEFELRARRFDGVYRWFQLRGRPLRDRQSRIIRWYFLQTDVDELKLAEETLKSSERNLKTIIDTIPGVAWSARPDGTADFLNQTYLDYTGLTAEEGMDWGWTAAVHPDDVNGLLAYWRRATSAGESAEAEARLRRHDGEYRWFLFRSNALRDEEGKIIKWYGTNIDIEARKRAEEELRRNENFLATAQRLSQSGSFSWCLDTNEVTFSGEALRIFGFAHDSPVTLQQIDNRIHPEDRHILPEKRKEARTVGEGQDYQIRLLMPDRSVKYLHTTSSEIRDASGRRLYIGALQDVTQRRLAREALDKAQSELAHVTRITALSALTASIAHEINQPLAGIITNASTCLRMLQGNPPNVDGARETARRTIRDGNRASDVITRLRALFSKKEFTLELMDLNQAAQEVIALALNDLQRNGVTVQSELAEDLVPVDGDRVQLQQVILNLIRNASEAMDDVHDRPRRLLIRTEHEGNGYVRLSVRDAGVGFEGENVDKIFDPFYTTKSGGMGIGLAVSRSIIDRHQGRLWAVPNDGPGATFAFTIPSGSEGVSGAAPGAANS
jgi:PAS domain S-box-containing protein